MDLHILSGSFTSLSLFLLAFSPANRSLRLLRTIPGSGPHQYISQTPQAIYATTWASPPALHAWALPSLTHIGSTPITATSSYIATLDSHAYSMGGPTGEKVQEVLFVEPDELEGADKTRKALRYGSHCDRVHERWELRVRSGPWNGGDTYLQARFNGTLERVGIAKGQAGDGPRHVKVHPNGEVLYCVAEHSNKLDVYTFSTTPIPSLTLVASQPLYASGSAQSYRGDTLLLTPSANQIFATTRGATSLNPGYIAVFSLSPSGLFSGQAEYYETPTSGGKAHAIDLFSKSASTSLDQETFSVPTESVWILLTDDDPCTRAAEPCASVRILEWDGWGTGGIHEVTVYDGTEMQGGSHAIFLREHAVTEGEVRHDEL
ncbi:hypothetical protein EDD18DRAFT_1319693 [Armillaria luteobubalina]|uniref:Isomerase YbhE n=1 Tax=Armillaria luteobubalina TaxID=153913 RepID=A0AA39UP51_9AGAR|nr:hypothetical protein EDD18DRAFT_1319693 [Armillaria luteobubalina]